MRYVKYTFLIFLVFLTVKFLNLTINNRKGIISQGKFLNHIYVYKWKRTIRGVNVVMPR